ncbi:Os06g0285500, partial [Oryza sativa Japonica Group]
HIPFTNSHAAYCETTSHVAKKWATDLKGQTKLEDAKFDWNTLGTLVQEVNYI